MNEDIEGKPRKKPYVKPALTEIKLAGEEAVLAACKGNGTTSAQLSTKCYVLDTGNPCRVIGKS
jgi:hypothetical protein